jgi:hypothetical protein
VNECVLKPPEENRLRLIHSIEIPPIIPYIVAILVDNLPLAIIRKFFLEFIARFV